MLCGCLSTFVAALCEVLIKAKVGLFCCVSCIQILLRAYLKLIGPVMGNDQISKAVVI